MFHALHLAFQIFFHNFYNCGILTVLKYIFLVFCCILHYKQEIMGSSTLRTVTVKLLSTEFIPDTDHKSLPSLLETLNTVDLLLVKLFNSLCFNHIFLIVITIKSN